MTQASVALITGGAGFIGTRLGATLAADGWDVVAMDNLHPQVHREPPVLPEAMKLEVADVTEAESWDDVLPRARPDIVIHLAAETGTGQSLTEATRHASVNVVGTTQMLDAFIRHEVRPRQIVLASSRAVYGEGEWSDGDTEGLAVGMRSTADLARGKWDPSGSNGKALTPLPSSAGRTIPRPTSVYGATKLAQEHILRAWALPHEVPLTVLRLQNVYGPGQAVHNAYTGVLTLFARLALDKQEIPVYEDGAIVRDFIFVDDVVDALWRVVRQPPAAGESRLLDIGSGERTSILSVASTLAAYAGAPTPRITGQYRLGDVRAALCDPTSARDELGWRSRWAIEDGLRALLKGVESTI